MALKHTRASTAAAAWLPLVVAEAMIALESRTPTPVPKRHPYGGRWRGIGACGPSGRRSSRKPSLHDAGAKAVPVRRKVARLRRVQPEQQERRRGRARTAAAYRLPQRWHTGRQHGGGGTATPGRRGSLESSEGGHLGGGGGGCASLWESELGFLEQFGGFGGAIWGFGSGCPGTVER